MRPTLRTAISHLRRIAQMRRAERIGTDDQNLAERCQQDEEAIATVINAAIPCLYRASIDTPNFAFHAYGTSGDQALGLVLKGWKKHKRQTGAAWDLEADEVQIERIKIGVCYRDGMAI